MITYRKSPYVAKTLAFTNITHMIMDPTKTLISDYDSGSFIVLTNNTFDQLNIFTNVTALAYYNGQ
jgi:hypothetical protein